VPSIPDLASPLRDDHVALRLAAERDIPEILIAYEDDPELHARLGTDRPPSGAELGRRMERLDGDMAAGTAVTLTILKPGSDECRGQLNVHRIDWDNLRAELGIWLAPQARGNGLARAALRLAAGWMFSAWGLERVAILTEPDNEPMLRAARGAGFVEEGVFRSYGRELGQRVDLTVLSLLPGDLAGSG
jgi:RimJ/RimL family protein N-acetyltransferase